jgi:predicted DsbA family dithiol-disulfide isomerase
MCYEEGENISLPDTCIRAVQKMSDLDVAQAKKVFAEGLFYREVIADDTDAKEGDSIDGVPYFVVSAEGSKRGIALAGCNPPATFMSVFQKVLGGQ